MKDSKKLTFNLFTDKNRCTTKKIRFVSGNQQILRVDKESNQPISSKLETKIGKLEGWNPEEFIRGTDKTYSITNDEKVLGRFTDKELKDYLEDRSIGIATNGVMYRTDKDGLLPALLRKWFDERVEYRKLSRQQEMFIKKIVQLK